MARFPLVDPATATDPVAQRAFQEIERELGFGMVPNIFRSMGAHPPLLAANWRKFKATVLERNLPRAFKEMLGVVVSDVNGSEYAKQVHLHSLGVQGIQDLWLEQLLNEEQGGAALPETMRAAVAFTRVAARDPHALRPGAFDELRAAGLTQEEVFEIVATIDLFQSVNAYTDLAGVPIDAI